MTGADETEAAESENEAETSDEDSVRKLTKAVGATSGIGIGGGMLGSEFADSAQAANRTVVDDFDYSSSSKMKSYYYFETGKSNAGLTTVSSTPTSDASSSVLEISGGTTEMVAYDDDDGYDLQAYPQVGDTIACWIRGANATENVNVTYGAVDGDGRNDHYYVKVNMEKSLLGMGVTNDGNSTWLATAPEDPTFSTNTWYKLEIQWTDGSTNTHDVTLYDQNGNALASFTYDGSDSADPNFEGTGFGYDAYVGSTGETAYFDYATTSGSDSTSSSLVIDDFEDNDLSEYNFLQGESGATVVSAPTVSGDYALEISDTDTEMVTTTEIDTPSAPGMFSYWVRATAGADTVQLNYGVQDHQNRYCIRIDFANDDFVLSLIDGGTEDTIDSDTSSLTLLEDTWYNVTVYWGKNGRHEVTLYDSGKTVRSRLEGLDSTWSTGEIGYDGYLNSGGTVNIDTVKKYRPDYSEFGTDVIDNFEDGDLSEYIFDRGSSGTSVVTSPTYSGSYALEISGTSTEMISRTGLSCYPSAGDTFSYWVRGSGGADMTNFTYGVQDHENRYFVRVNIAEDRFKLYVYESGSATRLDKDVDGFTLSQDTWYRVEIDWEFDGNHTVGLYTASDELLSCISGFDSTWRSGGIGFDSYLSSGESVYFDSVVMPKSDGSDGSY